MNKVLLSFVFIFSLSVAAFAQNEDKPASSQPISPELSAIQVANNLAKYGYANRSASALIGAAEIFKKTPVQQFAFERVAGEETANADVKKDKPEFTPENLLADAKKYAAGDATMLAWVEKVDKLKAEATRGAVGGPKIASGKVYANSSISYTCSFRAGELAEVAVSGDGDTDLDLYIYDANGNLITSDTSYGDDCYVSWVPRWTGSFTIKIKNLGRVYNNFTVVTN